jgi:hypothetical protein
MLVVIAVPLASAAYHLSPRRSWPLIATASAWAAVGAWGTIQAVGDMREHGMDYATAAQRPLALSAAAQTALPLFSNSPALIWLGTRKDARCPPVAVARISCGGVEDNRTLQARLPRRSVLLLFGAEDPHATPPRLGTSVRILSSRSYSDGTSLVLSRR